MNVRLYVAQRLTAALMAPLVIGHIVTILYAVRSGLSGGEILARTQGSIGWAAFYGLFVVAAAIHGTIGLRTVVEEWTPLRGRALNISAWIFGIGLAVLGMRAVYAVVAA